ncbi:MAG: sensor histidine kinase [Akkermansiaceae bacterium]|nr:sensor histidine kinase [Akkermansiaceae bacterium]
MRHLRGWMVWATLGVCALMVLGTMTGLTRSVLRSERSRAYAESRADLLEKMRLALWRMDGFATAWITDESQRPVLSAPSGQLDDPRQEVLLRFEAREDGAVVSGDTSRVFSLERALKIENRDCTLFARIGESMPPIPAAWGSRAPSEEPPVPAEESKRDSAAYQQNANSKELAGRGRVVNRALGQSQQVENVAKNWGTTPSTAWQLLQSGLPRPAMIDGQLFLLRHLQWRMPDGQIIRTIQGSWIDASVLQAKLLEEVSDLLPAGHLLPTPAKTIVEGITLASFPFWQLEPPAIPNVIVPLPKTVTIPLLVGWVAALSAIATASLLVRGVMRLSERRASFVSAVTHELRTPLTTFRLYSEMLETGAVKEEKRSDYLRILSRESDRLAHLVENVLAFSRIERGSARSAVREASIREILEPLRERFEARLTIAGMELRMNLQSPSGDAPVKVDAAAVEHILFNLVDNAAKYASAGQPPEVTIRVVGKAASLGIYVEDNGPGISPAKRDRIFQPFHKSARDAAESRPGVGLGLALSRRLARGLGGDLHYEQRQGKMGAIFTLRLPLT